MPIFQRKE